MNRSVPLVRQTLPSVRSLGATLRRLLDPIGPLGEILSPADVYKSRAGLPIQSPHVARAAMEAPADVERTLAPVRFVALGDAADVPRDRIRQVGPYIEEHWTPVYRRTDSTDLVEILLASQEQVGWEVRQRESQASRLARRARINAEQFSEVIQTAQIQSTEDFYVQYMETIPGDDPLMIDGKIVRGEAVYEVNEDGSRGKLIHDGTIRGGTMVRSRKHYNALTKNMVHWDEGTLREHRKAEAEYLSRPVRNVRTAMESLRNELPMWRPVGINFRRDRRSAV